MSSNADRTPGEVEARLTALLLGELSAEEAAAVQRELEHNAELARLHAHLQRTVELVREAAQDNVEESSVRTEPLKLSEARRQQLLQTFRTVTPKEFAHPSPSRRELGWAIPMAVAAMLIALLGVPLLAPVLAPAKARRQTVTAGLSKEALADKAAPAESKARVEFKVADAEVPKMAREPIALPSLAENTPAPTQPDVLPANGNITTSLGASHGAEPEQKYSWHFGVDPNTLSKGIAQQEARDIRSGGGLGGGAGGGAVQSTSPASNSDRLTALADYDNDAALGFRFQSGAQIAANRPAQAGPQPSFAPTLPSNEEAGLKDRVPILGDVPLMGRFFRSEKVPALAQGSASPDNKPLDLFSMDEISGNIQAGQSSTTPAGPGVLTGQGNQLFGGFRGGEAVPGGQPPVNQQFDTKAQAVAGTTLGVPLTTVLPPAPAVNTLADQQRVTVAVSPDGAAIPSAGNRSPAMPNQKLAELTPREAPLEVLRERVSPAKGDLVQVDKVSNAAGPVADLGQGVPAVRLEGETVRGLVPDQTLNSAFVQDGRMLMEMGKLDEAEAKLREAAKQNPEDRNASYYLGLVDQARQTQEARQREISAKDALAQVERAWNTPTTREHFTVETGRPVDTSNRTAGGIAATLEPKTVRGFERQQAKAEELAGVPQRTDSKASGYFDAAKLNAAPVTAPATRRLSEQAVSRLSVETEKAKAAPGPSNQKRGPEDLGVTSAPAESTVALTVADTTLPNTDTTTLSSQAAAGDRFSSIQPSSGITFSLSPAPPPATPVPMPMGTEAGKKIGLWERLSGAVTGNYHGTAQIRIQPQETDGPSVLFGAKSQTTFDPYFHSTQLEKIKSKDVLYRVIKRLKLSEEWARKNGGGSSPTVPQTYQLLLKKLEVHQNPQTGLVQIRALSDSPEEANRIAETVAQVYQETREEERQASANQAQALETAKVQEQRKKAEQKKEPTAPPSDPAPPKPSAPAPVPQPEVQTPDNAFSTFSLNVSDVSYKLAAASLEKGQMPDPATVRSEEFLNAFDYHDPEPPPSAPIGFTWERARYPFAHDRDLLRFSIKTAAIGRASGRPLNLVLLLDKSGSMERADRVRIVQEALRVLAAQLQPQDKLSVITFARTARLWADGVTGNQVGPVIEQVSHITPEGGTNLEDALNLAYQTALKQYLQTGINRVVLLTDGAANLGNVDAEALQKKVEAHRQKGIALDCFGIGWEGFNDNLLETLSNHGDGRYGFLNTPEEAANGFAGQLAGALRVAAADVKVQVEFNPKRVTVFRQIGYAKHQLTKQQFRDNTVDAAEIGAAESGNALYVVRVDAQGSGPLGTVRVRYKVPNTSEFREQEWTVPYTGNAVPLEQSTPALRLAGTAAAFSEWLVSSPFAAEVTPDRLLACLSGVPDVFGADPRPRQLEWMIRQAKSLK